MLVLPLHEPPALVLGRLYVLPTVSVSGIGRRLLAAAIAAHPEATTVALKVEAANAAARAFYAGQGFTVNREAIEDGALVLHWRSGWRDLTAPKIRRRSRARRR